MQIPSLELEILKVCKYAVYLFPICRTLCIKFRLLTLVPTSTSVFNSTRVIKLMVSNGYPLSKHPRTEQKNTPQP